MVSTLKSMKMPKNILVFNDHDPFTSPDALIRLSTNGSHSKGHHFLNLRINREKTHSAIIPLRRREDG